MYVKKISLVRFETTKQFGFQRFIRAENFSLDGEDVTHPEAI